SCLKRLDLPRTLAYLRRPMAPKTILDFWFATIQETPEYLKTRMTRWFSAGAELDREIKMNFETALNDYVRGKFPDWKSSSTGRLAAIILLDQFSRHIFRGTPEAFAQDKLALSLVEEGISN